MVWEGVGWGYMRWHGMEPYSTVVLSLISNLSLVVLYFSPDWTVVKYWDRSITHLTRQSVMVIYT